MTQFEQQNKKSEKATKKYRIIMLINIIKNKFVI